MKGILILTFTFGSSSSNKSTLLQLQRKIIEIGSNRSTVWMVYAPICSCGG